MVVEVWVIPVKPGHSNEIVEMLQAERAKFDDPNRMRIFVSEFGDASTVAYELEHESMAALEQTWAAWGASPDTPKFMEKWNKLVSAHGTRSLWTLVE
jgi:hypothetical protein